MDRSDLAIIIPAFNEDKTIFSVVSSVKPLGIPIVVDDNSSDATASRAIRAGARVVTHSANAGYDQALNTGFETAVKLNCRYAVTFDADGQHERGLIKTYMNCLTTGKSDIVIGIRPRSARLSESIFSLVSKIKWGIKDPLCGMKGYNLNLYREKGCFDSYTSIGTELSLYAAAKQYTITQVKIPISPRKDRPRFSGLLRADLKILTAMIKGLKRY